jgi:AcrR family transcriptional regulator
LLSNPDITVADVADRIGVSPATLYRYIPAARAANVFESYRRAMIFDGAINALIRAKKELGCS